MQKSKQQIQNLFKSLGYWPGIALCFLIVLTGLYLMFPSQQYDQDVLAELARINILDSTSPDPAHMLYVIIGIPFYKLWLVLGYTGDALRPMQVLNALFGAVAITAFVLILRQIRISRVIAVPIAITVGFSYAFWTHTEDAFFIIPAACFALIAWLCAFVLADAKSNERCWVITPLLAISLGLCVLFYQTNLLVVPALMAASWPGLSRKRAWTYEWLAIGLLVTLVAGGTWFYQATQFANIKTLEGVMNWFVSGHGGILRGLWRREGIPFVSTAIIAWGATILPLYEGMRLRDLFFNGNINPRYFPSQLALACLCCIIGLAALEIIAFMRKKRKLTLSLQVWLACGLWFIIPGLAVLWFDRAEVKLWLIPMFAFWIILASILDNKYRSRKHRKNTPMWIGFVLFFPVIVGISNFMLAIWPDYSFESDEIYKAEITITQMGSNDMLVSSKFDWTGYVRYFCPECRVMNVIGIAQSVPIEEQDRVKDILWDYMDSIWQQGGTVYVVEYLVNPQDPIWGEWITPYTGLTYEDFSVFEFEIAWQVKDEIVWEINPIP